MRIALYARVSSEAQAERGTVGSQLEALRDAAEAGRFEALWCLTPDRLARAYALQVLILDELARLGVTVRFLDAPASDDDPQARLLVQMQGVIAEYERAKSAERHRRGKLYRARARAGEAIFWKVPYGYRRVPRTEDRPAHLVVHEPEAAVVRRIFDDYAAGGLSMRAICRRLYEDAIPSQPHRQAGVAGLDPVRAAAQPRLRRHRPLVPPRDPAARPAGRSASRAGAAAPTTSTCRSPCPRLSLPRPSRPPRSQAQQPRVQPAPRRPRRLAVASPGGVRAV